MKFTRTAVAVSSLLLSSLAHAAVIKGTVVDSTGKPVANASIEVIGEGKTLKTNDKGEFSYQSDVEKAELHVFAKGFAHKNLVWEQQPVEVVLVNSVIEQIDVVGSPIHSSNLESATPVNVLAGDNLRNKQAATLGETLKNELGVHSSYFGPVASSPIIRGLDGPRVLVTQNGLDVSDASRVGPDHVVSTEASTARQIEVLRGPATLIYGSGAIGGVVNVVDNRVPTSTDFDASAQLSFNSVADEKAAAVNLDTGEDNIAFHFDAFWRDADNYDIPGPAVLEDHEGETEEEHAEHDTGKLENSSFDAKGFNLGASYLLDNGYVGFSYGRLDKNYGIPGHSHAEEHGEEEHAEEEASVRGDLKQDRWQLVSELDLDGDFFTGVNTRVGYTDYSHAEIENGVVGTTFENQTFQFKTDLMMHEFAGWRGALSLEYKDTDFAAKGEEAFTPDSNTSSFSLAYMQEKHFDDVLVQWGLRVERVELDASPFEVELGHHDEHEEEEHEEQGAEMLDFDQINFVPVSFSLGTVWDFAPGYNLGVSFTHAQRAPSASELFSFGPHIGTNSFEVGAMFELHRESDEEVHFDPVMDKPKVEKSNNIDLSLRKFEGDTGFIFNLFYNQVSDYYYQSATGLTRAAGHDHEEEHGHEDEHAGEEGHAEEAAGLPVYVFQQDDVTLYGYEAEFIWQATEQLKTKVISDYIRGKLDDGGNLPRIPPMRLGAVFNYEWQDWQAEFSAMHYFKQDDITAHETETDAYTMLDAKINYRFFMGDQEMVTFLKLNNITDEEARVHASFLKNQTLLPGRGVEIGIRGYF